MIGYIRGYRQALDRLYDPKNKQAALDLFVQNVPNSTLQSATVAYDIMLHPRTGFERNARLDEAGARTVVALREKYGRPAKKLQPVSASYEPRYYRAAGGWSRCPCQDPGISAAVPTAAGRRCGRRRG